MALTRISLALLAVCLPVSAQAAITYKEPPKSSYPETTSVVQRVWNSAMDASSSMAGVPNGHRRGTEKERLKNQPMALERAATATLDASNSLGGARQAFNTEGDLPRRSLKTMNEKLSSGPIHIQSAPNSAPMIKGVGDWSASAPAMNAPANSTPPVIMGANNAPPMIMGTKSAPGSIDQSKTLTTPILRR